MTRKFLILAISLLTVSAVYGRQISEQSAKELALGFYAKKSATLKIAPAVATDVNLVHKQMTGENVDLYVFNRGKNDGFVIVSAEDAVAPILGYSATGEFSPESMSPSMKSWLEEYARQIEYVRNNPMISSTMESDEDFLPIEPMIKTLWEQSEPYNRQCPEYKGERCLTGCAATAMAMVMKYYEYPTTGTGSHSYRPINNRKLGTLTADFGSTTYDWANMRDEYWWGTYTDEEANAVATLMYHCGVSLEMQYSPTSSGAYAKDWMTALKNFFGYDDGVHLIYRDYYSEQGWNEVIYNELSAGRPVLYSGSSPSGGHAFVCDGYSADGYFHINWGWAGMSDGYFLLSALDPYEMGSGGSDGGFNYNQSVTIGIKPNDGIRDNDYPRILMAGDFSYLETEGAYDWFSGESDPNGYEGFLNLSNEDVEAELGLLIRNKLSGEEIINSTEPLILESMTARIVPFEMESLDLIDGEYEVYPICRYAGNENWQLIPVRDRYQQYLILTVTDGIRTYSNQENVKHYNLEVINFLRNKMYENEEVEFSAIVQNYDNVSAAEKIYFRCFTQATGEEVLFGGGNWAKPAPNAMDEVNYYMQAMPLEAGTYYIKFYDSMDNLISDSYLMEVLPGSKIEVLECEYDKVIYAERNFSMQGVFTNTGVRDFEGAIVFRMLDDTGYEGYFLNLGTYTLPIGESADFEVEVESFFGLEAGKYYALLSIVCGKTYKDLCEPIVIEVTDESTIESVGIDVSADAEYYNLQGVRIDNPSKGLYIRKQGGKVEKVYIK